MRVDDGHIRIVGGAPGRVEVSFHNRARAADRAGAEALLDNVRTEATQDGDVVRVRARAHTAGQVMIGGGVWSEVTIRVPRESTTLDIRIDDGRIDIDDVTGTIDAETGDGRVQVADVTGTVRLRTHDGSITATRVRGDVDVLSEDGRLRLDGSFARLRAVTADGSVRIQADDASAIEDDWSIRTSDGSVELTVPRSLDAELEATTSDGRVTNDLSTFQGTEDRRRIKGTVGAGGPKILVTTMDGRIELKEY